MLKLSIANLLYNLYMKDKQPNYYDILGVDRRATSEEITKAYRQQALKFHPDRHSSGTDTAKAEAEAKFKELGQAYETLNDASTRFAYDASLIIKVATRPAPAPQQDAFKSTFDAAQRQASRSASPPPRPTQPQASVPKAQTAREKAAAAEKIRMDAVRLTREREASRRKAAMESAKVEREKVAAARNAVRESARIARERASVTRQAVNGAQSILRQQARDAAKIFEAMKAQREMLQGKRQPAQPEPRAAEQPSTRYANISKSVNDLMSALKEVVREGVKDFSDIIKKHPLNKENSKQISFGKSNPVKVIDNEKGIELSLRKTDKGYELCPPLKGNFTLAMPNANGKGMDMISVKDGKVVDGVFANGSSKNKSLDEVRSSVMAQSLTSAAKAPSSLKPDPTPSTTRRQKGTARGA